MKARLITELDYGANGLYTGRVGFVVKDEDGEPEEIAVRLSPAKLRALANELCRLANLIEWHEADVLYIGGPPLHIVVKGEGRSECGYPCDERQAQAIHFSYPPALCKRCERNYKKRLAAHQDAPNRD